jgi:hypothetical protein
MPEDPRPDEADVTSEEPSGQGAEAYGEDPDAEPSVTPEEVDRGQQRDQAEG